MRPPIAKKKKKKLVKHKDVRIDSYYWLNERENPEVIHYLEEENAYTKEILKDTEAFQKDLFFEMKGRIKEDDESVPYKFNGYWYYARFIKDGEYPIHARKKAKLANKEEVLFDVNDMAKGHSYYNLNGINITENNQLVAFGTDTLSRRIYSIQIKDLKTGELLPDRIENTTGHSVWANDNTTLFYTRKDDKLRPYQIWKHILGTDTVEDDELVYEEKDECFNAYVYKSKSREYLIIGSSSTLSDEYLFISADEPNSEWKTFQERVPNLEYSISHYEDHFYILTNKDNAINFKLMKTAVDETKMENWVEVIPHRDYVLLEGFEIFKDYLVVEEREHGLIQLNIKSWDKKADYYLPFREETYTAWTSANPEFNSNILRYGYTSLTTPASIIDFNMSDKSQEVKKEQTVLGDFNKEDYTSERSWAKGRDGENIPISLVYRKDITLTETTPLLLYAYGSYGYTIDPTFSTTRLSLLNRGFVFAIAHIRGGQYLGRNWYENGKFLKKKNTFYDFIDAAQHLIREQYTSPAHLYAMGGSAGGLLMGAVINSQPELFNGIIASVPFVDVVTTMLDESIPLTTGEYEEWGNPNDKEYYDYIKSYSPYDNVQKQNYPHMLVTTGLHDSQVQYWEPAKWVAKLRTHKKNDNLLLLQTDMTTGHGGASGRFEGLKQIALEYAFLFMLEDINH